VTRDMLHQKHGRLQVYGVHEVPVLVVDFKERLKLAGHAGAVDENIDASELLQDFRDVSTASLALAAIPVSAESTSERC
jgi:hypothetical protein